MGKYVIQGNNDTKGTIETSDNLSVNDVLQDYNKKVAQVQKNIGLLKELQETENTNQLLKNLPPLKYGNKSKGTFKFDPKTINVHNVHKITTPPTPIPDNLDKLWQSEINKYVNYNKDDVSFDITNPEKLGEFRNKLDSVLVNELSKEGLHDPMLIYDLAGKPNTNIMQTLLDDKTWEPRYTPSEQSIFNYRTLPLPLLAAVHNGYYGIVSMLTGKKQDNYISNKMQSKINKWQDYKDYLYELEAHTKAIDYNLEQEGIADKPKIHKLYANPTKEQGETTKNTLGLISEGISNFFEGFYKTPANIFNTLLIGRDRNGTDLIKNILYPENYIKDGVTPQFANPEFKSLIFNQAKNLGIVKDEEDYNKLLETADDPRALYGSLGYTLGSLLFDIKLGGFKLGTEAWGLTGAKILNRLSKAKEFTQAVDYTKLANMPRWQQYFNAIGWSVNPANWGKEVKYTESLAPSLYAQFGHPFNHVGNMAAGGFFSYLLSMDPTFTVDEALKQTEDMATLGLVTNALGNSIANSVRFLRPFFKGTQSKILKNILPVLNEDPLIFSKQMDNTINMGYHFGTVFGIPAHLIGTQALNFIPPKFNNEFIQNLVIGAMFTGAGLAADNKQRALSLTEEYNEFYQRHPREIDNNKFRKDRTFYDILQREADFKGLDINNLTGTDLLNLSKEQKQTKGIQNIFNEHLKDIASDIKVKPAKSLMYDNKGNELFAQYEPSSKTIYIDNITRNPGINKDYTDNFYRIFTHEMGHEVLTNLYDKNPEFKTEIDDLYETLKTKYYDNKESELYRKIGKDERLNNLIDYIFEQGHPQEFLAHLFDPGTQDLRRIFESLPIESSEKGQVGFLDKLKSIFSKPETIGSNALESVSVALGLERKDFLKPIEENYSYLNKNATEGNSEPLGMTSKSLVHSELLPGVTKYKPDELQELSTLLEDYNKTQSGIRKTFSIFDIVNEYESKNGYKPQNPTELANYIRKQIYSDDNKVPLTDVETDEILFSLNQPLPEYLKTKEDTPEQLDADYNDLSNEVIGKNGLMLGLDSQNSVIEYFMRQNNATGQDLKKVIEDKYRSTKSNMSDEDIMKQVNRDYLLISNTVPRQNLSLALDLKEKTLGTIIDKRTVDTNGETLSQWSGENIYLKTGLSNLYNDLKELGGQNFIDNEKLLYDLFKKPNVFHLGEIQIKDKKGNLISTQKLKSRYGNNEIFNYKFYDDLAKQGYFILPKTSGAKFLYSDVLKRIANDPLLSAKTMVTLEFLALKHYLTSDNTWDYNSALREQVTNILPNLESGRLISNILGNSSYTDNEIIKNIEPKNRKDILESGLIPQIVKKIKSWIHTPLEYYYYQDKFNKEMVFSQIFNAGKIEDLPKYLRTSKDNKPSIMDYTNQNLLAKINSLVSIILDSGDNLRTAKEYTKEVQGIIEEHKEYKKNPDKYLSILTGEDKLRLKDKEDVFMFIPEAKSNDGNYSQEWLNNRSANNHNGELNYTSYFPDPLLFSNSEYKSKLSDLFSDSGFFIANNYILSDLQAINGTDNSVDGFKPKQLIYENGNSIIPKTYLNGTILKQESNFANLIKQFGKHVSFIGNLSAMKGKTPYRIKEVEAYTNPDNKLIISQIGEVLAVKNAKGEILPKLIDGQINPEPNVKKEMEYITRLHDSGIVPNRLKINLPMTGPNAMSFIGYAKVQNDRVKSALQLINNPVLQTKSFIDSPKGQLFADKVQQLENNIARNAINDISDLNTANLVFNKASLQNIVELKEDELDYSNEELLNAQKGFKIIAKQIRKMDPKMSQFFSNIDLDKLINILGDVEHNEYFPKEKLPLLFAITQKVFNQGELADDKPTMISNLINKTIQSANTIEVDANTITYIPDTDAIGQLKNLINYELQQSYLELNTKLQSGEIDDTEYEQLYPKREKELAQYYKDITENYIDSENNSYKPGSQGLSIDWWSLQSINKNSEYHYGIGSPLLIERKATMSPKSNKAVIITGLTFSPNHGTFDSYTAKEIMSMDNDKDGFQIIMPDSKNMTPDIFNTIHEYLRNLGLDKGAYDYANDIISNLFTLKDGNTFAINKLLGIENQLRIMPSQHQNSMQRALEANDEIGQTYGGRKLIKMALQNIKPNSTGKRSLDFETDNGEFRLDDKDEWLNINGKEINKNVLLTDLITQSGVDDYGHGTWKPSKAFQQAFIDILKTKEGAFKNNIENDILKELMTLSGQSVEYSTKEASKNPADFLNTINDLYNRFNKYVKEGKVELKSVPAQILTGLMEQLNKFPGDIGIAKNNEIFKMKIDSKTADIMSEYSDEARKYSGLTEEELDGYHRIMQMFFIPILNSLPSQKNNGLYYKDKYGNTDLFSTFRPGSGRTALTNDELAPFTDKGYYGNFKRAIAGSIYRELYNRFPYITGQKHLYIEPYGKAKISVDYNNGKIIGTNMSTNAIREVPIRKLFDKDGNITVNWIKPERLADIGFRNLIDYNRILSNYELMSIITNSVSNGIKKIPISSFDENEANIIRGNIATSLLYGKWQTRPTLKFYTFGIGLGDNNSFASLKRSYNETNGALAYQSYKDLLSASLRIDPNSQLATDLTLDKTHFNPLLLGQEMSKTDIIPMVTDKPLEELTLERLNDYGKEIFGTTEQPIKNTYGMTVNSLKKAAGLIPFVNSSNENYVKKTYDMLPLSIREKNGWNTYKDYSLIKMTKEQYNDVFEHALKPMAKEAISSLEKGRTLTNQQANEILDNIEQSFDPVVIFANKQFYGTRWGGKLGSQLHTLKVFQELKDGLENLKKTGNRKYLSQYYAGRVITPFNDIYLSDGSINRIFIPAGEEIGFNGTYINGKRVSELKPYTMADSHMDPLLLTQNALYHIASQIPAIIEPIRNISDTKDYMLNRLANFEDKNILGPKERITDIIKSMKSLNSFDIDHLFVNKFIDIKTTFDEIKTTTRIVKFKIKENETSETSIDQPTELMKSIKPTIEFAHNDLIAHYKDNYEDWKNYIDLHGIPEEKAQFPEDYKEDILNETLSKVNDIKNYILLKSMTQEIANGFYKMSDDLISVIKNNKLEPNDPERLRLETRMAKLQDLASKYSNMDYTNIDKFLRGFDGKQNDLISNIKEELQTVRKAREDIIAKSFKQGITHPYQLTYFDRLLKMAKGEPVDVNEFIKESLNAGGVKYLASQIAKGLDKDQGYDALHLLELIGKEATPEEFASMKQKVFGSEEQEFLSGMKTIDLGRIQRLLDYWEPLVEQNAKKAALAYNEYISNLSLSNPELSYYNLLKNAGYELPDLYDNPNMTTGRFANLEEQAKSTIENLLSSYENKSQNDISWHSIFNKKGYEDSLGIPESEQLQIEHLTLEDILASLQKVNKSDKEYFNYSVSNGLKQLQDIYFNNISDIQSIGKDIYLRKPDAGFNHKLTIDILSTANNSKVLMGINEQDRPYEPIDIEESKNITDKKGKHFSVEPGTYAEIKYDTGQELKTIAGRYIGNYVKNWYEEHLYSDTERKQYSERPFTVLYDEANRTWHEVDMDNIKQILTGRPYGERWYSTNKAIYKRQKQIISDQANNILDLLAKDRPKVEIRKMTVNFDNNKFMFDIYQKKDDLIQALRPIAREIDTNIDSILANKLRNTGKWLNTSNAIMKYFGAANVVTALTGGIIGTLGLIQGSPTIEQTGLTFMMTGGLGYGGRRLMQKLGNEWNTISQYFYRNKGLTDLLRTIGLSFVPNKPSDTSPAISKIAGQRLETEKLENAIGFINNILDNQDKLREIKNFSWVKKFSDIQEMKKTRKELIKAGELLDNLRTNYEQMNDETEELFLNLANEITSKYKDLKLDYSDKDRLIVTYKGHTPQEILAEKIRLLDLGAYFWSRKGKVQGYEFNSAINSYGNNMAKFEEFKNDIESNLDIKNDEYNQNAVQYVFEHTLATLGMKQSIGDYFKTLGQKEPGGQFTNMFKYFGWPRFIDQTIGMINRNDLVKFIQSEIKKDPDYKNSIKYGYQLFDYYIHKPIYEEVTQAVALPLTMIGKSLMPLALAYPITTLLSQLGYAVNQGKTEFLWDYMFRGTLWMSDFTANMIFSIATFIGLDINDIIDTWSGERKITERDYTKQVLKGAQKTGEAFSGLHGAGMGQFLNSAVYILYLLGKLGTDKGTRRTDKHMKNQITLESAKTVLSPGGFETPINVLQKMERDEILPGVYNRNIRRKDINK